MDDNTSVLEHFRQQWKEEVSAKTKRAGDQSTSNQEQGRARRPSELKPEGYANKPPTRHPAAEVQHDSDDDSEVGQLGGSISGLTRKLENLGVGDVDEDEFSIKPTPKEPRTALEHFEKAVEREGAGKLGDSLAHYRKAYKLDARVDQTYKNKHFPIKSKPSNLNPSNAPVTVPSTAHHSSEDPSVSLNITDLIQSFAGKPILGIPPVIERDRAPPCTIQRLPNEVIIHMLRLLGTRDPALLARLSLVCKKLAYHIFTDNSIWKRIALGPEFGLSGQRYDFATDVQGREVIFETLEEDEHEEQLPPVTDLSFPKDTLWRDLFHTYPRIRFSGVYISTVNYTRPGGASANQFTWSNPIHIVTYYRYLRFFRDGTCISLLTTSEPLEVVHHLTPENLHLVRSKGGQPNHPLNFTSSAPALQHLSSTQGPIVAPSAQNLMKHALRGRWRLCHPSRISEPQPRPGETPSQPTMLPGDLHIETEGAGPRYMYTIHLTLKSSSRSPHMTKNNKLVWKGFWSYNSLTNDWAEFGLKNDKPFYFSRVKSYGLGY
jgi:F-box protein 9